MSWANIAALVNDAVSAAGSPGGQSAIEAVVKGVKGNSQYANAANAALTQLQVALASTPQNQMAAMFAIQTLSQMVINGQLPNSISPDLTLLMNPAVQSNPVAVGQAIADIGKALQH